MNRSCRDAYEQAGSWLQRHADEPAEFGNGSSAMRSSRAPRGFESKQWCRQVKQTTRHGGRNSGMG